jgi:hypothetical protein
MITKAGQEGRAIMTTFLPLKAMQQTKTKSKRKKTNVSLSFIAIGVAQQKAIQQMGFLLWEEDFQVIELVDAINTTIQAAMSNQCTNYNLAVFSSLKGVVCIILRCCLLQCGANDLIVFLTCRLLLSW